MYQAIKKDKSNYTEAAEFSSFPKFAGAIGGIAGGLVLMLGGIIFSSVSYFSGISFHSLDVIAIAAAFIFLAVGAHFLDLMEREKKAKRIEYCKRQGFE